MNVVLGLSYVNLREVAKWKRVKFSLSKRLYVSSLQWSVEFAQIFQSKQHCHLGEWWSAAEINPVQHLTPLFLCSIMCNIVCSIPFSILHLRFCAASYTISWSAGIHVGPFPPWHSPVRRRPFPSIQEGKLSHKSADYTGPVCSSPWNRMNHDKIAAHGSNAPLH